MNRFLLAIVILAFPIAGYFLLQTGVNHFFSLPYYGPKNLSGTFHSRRGVKIPDTQYYSIPNYTLINQDSQIFSQGSLDTNTIYIAGFFYTRTGFMGTNLIKGEDSLVRMFRIHPDVKFLSISLDPEFDKPSLLKTYARKFHADTHQWYFLTGNKDSLFHLSRNFFFLNAMERGKDSLLEHSPYLVLVDPKHHIRGYYDVTRDEELKKLRDEIIVLRLEVLRKETDIIQH